MAQLLKKYFSFAAAVLITIVPLLNMPTAAAAPLLSRSVAIGSSVPSAVTTNQLNFTIPSYSALGSIEFEYCQNTPFPGTYCDPSPGQSVANATLTDQSGETGFTVHGTPTANRLVLTRPATASSGLNVSYTLSNTVNPDDVHRMVYVRISTFASEDATGPRTDTGEVIFSTARNLAVNGYVPPFLVFCVGVTVTLNCSSTNGNLLNFGELSTNQTKAVTSEYAGSSNDVNGFSTMVTGVTMISGNNTIPALGSPQPSRPGTGQFGMNLRANSNPGIGAEPIGGGTSVPVGGVASQNQFMFGSQVISNSPLSTDFNKFTASYIVNVAGDQRPGVYSTTLTYIASASF